MLAGTPGRSAIGDTACAAQPPASAAHAALQKDTTPTPALSAVAAIGTDASCGQQPGSYAVHPAVLDAATHTAAVFSGSSQSSNIEDHPSMTRIPAALDAFAAQQAAADAAAGSGKWCSGTLEDLRPDGSVVTSFDLGAGTARLAGFQAKVCIPRSLVGDRHIRHAILPLHGQ